MDKIIDLRSDTVTKPSKGMMDAIMKADLGDDVFGEDPTINALQEKSAELFNMEAALFCPSGTMTNQIAVKMNTEPGDEVIVDKTSHIYLLEGGSIAFIANASVRVVDGDRGRITPEQILENINAPDDHYPTTKLVSIENTSNRGGGSYYTLEEMKALGDVCKEHGLRFHLDGARIFNALEQMEIKAQELGSIFDSISFCLSKGLGAPVGSLVLGDKEFIRKSKRLRKKLGGGMRQGGLLAASGIYALENNIERLKEDHVRASSLFETLSSISIVEEVMPVDTNIILYKLKSGTTSADHAAKLLEYKIKALQIGPQKMRMVTHLDFDDEML